MQRASDVPVGPAEPVANEPQRVGGRVFYPLSSASVEHREAFERQARTFGRPSSELGNPSLEGERHFREVLDGWILRDW